MAKSKFWGAQLGYTYALKTMCICDDFAATSLSLAAWVDYLTSSHDWIISHKPPYIIYLMKIDSLYKTKTHVWRPGQRWVCPFPLKTQNTKHPRQRQRDKIKTKSKNKTNQNQKAKTQFKKQTSKQESFEKQKQKQEYSKSKSEQRTKNENENANA